MDIRIVSGGQTGVDRAALDAAIELGIPYGGWCPAGGWAEDLPEPPGVLARYPRLRATPGVEPAERTRWNVRDSDATLILLDSDPPAPSSGTALTIAVAAALGRPSAIVDMGAASAREAVATLIAAMARGDALNVAGPRESGSPGIYARARALLTEVLAER